MGDWVELYLAKGANRTSRCKLHVVSNLFHSIANLFSLPLSLTKYGSLILTASASPSSVYQWSQTSEAIQTIIRSNLDIHVGTCTCDIVTV